MGIKPKYEFGFGLSYTHFNYTNLKVEKRKEGVEVELLVKNTGRHFGGEVVQVYVSKPKTEHYTDEYRSPQDLKGFSKVYLAPGEERPVRVMLQDLDFSYWNTTTHLFTVEPGHYGVRVGSSSRDIRLNTTIQI